MAFFGKFAMEDILLEMFPTEDTDFERNSMEIQIARKDCFWLNSDRSDKICVEWIPTEMA